MGRLDSVRSSPGHLVAHRQRDAAHSLEDHVLALFLVVGAVVMGSADEEDHNADEKNAGGHAERKRIALSTEAAYVGAEDGRHNCADHRADVDAQIEHGEERFQVAFLTWVELISTESAHAWLDAYFNRLKKNLL